MATEIKVARYITPRKRYKVRVGVRWPPKSNIAPVGCVTTGTGPSQDELKDIPRVNDDPGSRNTSGPLQDFQQRLLPTCVAPPF